METSGGSPTRTGACAAVTPRRKVRRERRVRLLMTWAIGIPPGRWANLFGDERYHQLLETKAGVAEPVECAGNHRPVGGRVFTARHVAEQLLYHTLMTLRCTGEQLAESARILEIRVGNPGYPRGGIQIEQDLFHPGAGRFFGAEHQLVLVATHADGIEFL